MTILPDPDFPLGDEKVLRLKYDAWNRVVEVKDDSSTVIQTNEFDGLNRRIQKVVGSDSYDYYYNDQWQVLEIRKNGSGNPWKQYAYHPDYVDAIAVLFYDENTDGAGIVEHYYLQDANFNVTAVADDSGAVVERYAYTPYGEVTFLASNFSPLASTAIANELLYTGRRRDPETGLQLNRNRFYHQQLGRWVSQDPIGYDGGSFNLYEYVVSSPNSLTDPLGLRIDPFVERCTLKHFFPIKLGATKCHPGLCPKGYDCVVTLVGISCAKCTGSCKLDCSLDKDRRCSPYMGDSEGPIVIPGIVLKCKCETRSLF